MLFAILLKMLTNSVVVKGCRKFIDRLSLMMWPHAMAERRGA